MTYVQDLSQNVISASETKLEYKTKFLLKSSENIHKEEEY